MAVFGSDKDSCVVNSLPSLVVSVVKIRAFLDILSPSVALSGIRSHVYIIVAQIVL